METIGKIFSGLWKFIKWYFVTSLRWTLLLFGLIDLWLGDGSFWEWLNKPPDPPTPDPPTPENISRSTTNKVVKKYGKDLEKYVESKSTTSIESIILEKIKNSPGKLIKDVLSEGEMNIFIMMILKAYDLIDSD